MAFTKDSLLGDIVADDDARAVLDEFWPGCSTDPQSKMGYNMPFSQLVLYFPDVPSDEMMAQFDARLREIEDDE